MRILLAFFLFLFEVILWIYMAIASIVFVIIAGFIMVPFIILEALLGER